MDGKPGPANGAKPSMQPGFPNPKKMAFRVDKIRATLSARKDIREKQIAALNSTQDVRTALTEKLKTTIIRLVQEGKSENEIRDTLYDLPENMPFIEAMANTIPGDKAKDYMRMTVKKQLWKTYGKMAKTGKYDG